MFSGCSEAISVFPVYPEALTSGRYDRHPVFPGKFIRKIDVEK